MPITNASVLDTLRLYEGYRYLLKAFPDIEQMDVAALYLSVLMQEVEPREQADAVMRRLAQVHWDKREDAQHHEIDEIKVYEFGRTDTEMLMVMVAPRA